MEKVVIESMLEDVFFGLQNLFKEVKFIELDMNEETKIIIKNKFKHNSHNLFDRDIWESILKKYLKCSVTDEFAEFLLKEELLIPNISKENIVELKKFSRIGFYSINYSKIKSKQKSLFFPTYEITYPLTESNWFELILENSLCKDVQKYILTNHFSSGGNTYYFRSYLKRKAGFLLKDELEIVNDLSNEYISKKYKYFLRLVYEGKVKYEKRGVLK